MTSRTADCASPSNIRSAVYDLCLVVEEIGCTVEERNKTRKSLALRSREWSDSCDFWRKVLPPLRRVKGTKMPVAFAFKDLLPLCPYDLLWVGGDFRSSIAAIRERNSLYLPAGLAAKTSREAA